MYKVEAEGTWNGTTLTARKIEFKRAVVRLQGVVTDSTSPTFTLNVVGAGPINIETDEFTSGNVPLVTPNCVQVRGQRKAGVAVAITAGEITSCGSGGDHLIQAPVEVESGTTLTLLGFGINIGSPTDVTTPYQGLDGVLLSQTQFFAAVTPAVVGPPAVAGTLVKIRFNPNATVKQVELED